LAAMAIRMRKVIGPLSFFVSFFFISLFLSFFLFFLYFIIFSFFLHRILLTLRWFVEVAGVGSTDDVQYGVSNAGECYSPGPAATDLQFLGSRRLSLWLVSRG
jgi:hypothetical protein